MPEWQRQYSNGNAMWETRLCSVELMMPNRGFTVNGERKISGGFGATDCPTLKLLHFCMREFTFLSSWNVNSGVPNQRRVLHGEISEFQSVGILFCQFAVICWHQAGDNLL